MKSPLPTFYSCCCILLQKILAYILGLIALGKNTYYTFLLARKYKRILRDISKMQRSELDIDRNATKNLIYRDNS